MGCASSKRIEAAVDVYRPPPSSFAVFDVASIQEPWLSSADESQFDDNNHVLHKLHKLESAPDSAPRSWDEVSKDLETLKPAIKPISAAAAAVNPPPSKSPVPPPPTKREPRRSFSFHTLEELDSKSSTNAAKPKMRKSESARSLVEFKKPSSTAAESRFAVNSPFPSPSSETVVVKPVKENIFILRDRMEREKEGTVVIRRGPLDEFPEKCPPGGSDAVVVYTTSLRGVRKTYDACTRVLSLMELQRVATDERDVSLHAEFLTELRELVGESLSLPRVFIKGRYVGGVEEVEALNETGRLGRILNFARVERMGSERQACEGCGGARFVPCLECGGSCKVYVDGVNKGRCGKCNENGLAHCPACH
ncbi:Uncharacterized protein At5g39865 [Linum grandiflorum]